jgi:hypothetical protein
MVLAYQCPDWCRALQCLFTGRDGCGSLYVSCSTTHERTQKALQEWG